MAATSSLWPSERSGRMIDSLALLSWGSNSSGQLGQGHLDDQLIPKEVIWEKVVPQVISGGGSHTLILTDEGSLLTCGSNSKGQLGLDDKVDASIFTRVSFPFAVRIVQVASGWDFSLAVTDEGKLFSWGNNSYGQLGREPLGKLSTKPDQVDIPPGVHLLTVAAGMRHSLALSVLPLPTAEMLDGSISFKVIYKDDGVMYGWGQNKRGQIGCPANADGKYLPSSPFPIQVSLPTTCKVVQIVAGSNHSGALTDLGTVYLWGCNKFGQVAASLGTPHLMQPACISAQSAYQGHLIKQLAMGWSHNLGLTEMGEVYSWGRADYGQLGRPCDQPCDPMPQVIPTLVNICAVACGSEHNLALTAEGKLLCWGWNEHGMCGNGSLINVSLPSEVTVPFRGVLSVGCGAGHSYALVYR